MVWFRSIKEDTWVVYWDNSHGGYVSHDVLHVLGKMVGILGPTAAIFGREFEDYLINEKKSVTISKERFAQSVRNSSGALSKYMIDPVGTPNRNKQGSYSGENQESHERGQSSTKWVAKTT